MPKIKTKSKALRALKIPAVKPQTLLDQMQKVTTVHGTAQFGSKKGIKLTLWCALVVGNVLLTTYFLIFIKQKFNENQIVTQINANCKVSQIPFPSVSICNFNMVSLRESENIQNILKHGNRSKKEIEAFFSSLPYLTNYNIQLSLDFSEIMGILKAHYFTIDTIMEEVHQKCENLLLYCTFNRKPKDCQAIFRLVKTLNGFCCTFNYAALNDASEQASQTPDSDFEYYEDQNEDESLAGRIIMTSQSGSTSGLSVVLNIEPEDYASWSSVEYYGAKILITDPNDYPETTVLYRYIAQGESVDLKLDALVFQSSDELRRLTPAERGCWFYDEALLEHTDRYSFETCNTECKMKTYLDSCGCIPYKYPREKSNRICEFQDLKCLNNVTVNKSVKNMDCQPVCYVECRDKKYAVSSDLVPFVADGLPPEIITNHSTNELASLKVYFGKSNCNCYKMNLLIDFNYFIATYGGVFSLSFGASILTLFEFSFIFSTVTAKSIWRVISNVYK